MSVAAARERCQNEGQRSHSGASDQPTPDKPSGALSLPLPQPGDNVTIPYGWNLVIDVNVSLAMFTILGNVSFSTTADIALAATYIHPWPAPRAVTIILNGTRQTPGMNFDNTLPPGAKMLALTGGGRLSLWGQPAGQRWLKLAAATSNNTLLLSSPMHRWAVGQSVVVTSSTYNMQQAEVATIAGISPDRLTLTLTSPLAYAHEGLVKHYPGARDAADLRVEVGDLPGKPLQLLLTPSLPASLCR
ncbi:hypothetical protein V8C86DRAFT_3125351 [Haematococcus lacustris]